MYSKAIIDVNLDFDIRIYLILNFLEILNVKMVNIKTKQGRNACYFAVYILTYICVCKQRINHLNKLFLHLININSKFEYHYPITLL